jgi:hypothetical protein
MAPEQASAILGLWEECRDVDPITRSVVLSAAADPVVDPVEAARMPLGECTARLLRLRSGLRSGNIEATVQCPSCATELEFTVDPDALSGSSHGDPIESLDVDGRRIRWRLITASDLLIAAAQPDIASAERSIIEACLVEVSEDRRTSTGLELSDPERSALAGAIEAADPLSDLLFDLHCVGCDQPVTAELHISDVVWTELDGIARRLVSEVDTLARVYGWTEGECLSLSATRRSIYLELAAGGAR